jgi:hypothetical protein
MVWPNGMLSESSTYMKRILLLSVGLIWLFVQTASADLLESWEGSWDGWTTLNPNDVNASLNNSSSYGVTDGNYSLAVTSPGPEDPYNPILFELFSQAQSSYTTALASSSALTLDVYTPPGSFGNNLTIYMVIYNSDLGVSGLLNPETTTIGQETTLTFDIPSAAAAILAASSNTTRIEIEGVGGFTARNETAYLDNLQTVAIPEPATLEWVGLGAAGILVMRRRLTDAGIK